MNAELEKRVNSFPVLAGEVRVVDQPSLTRANEFLLVVKGLQREVGNTFDPIIEAAHRAHKEALVQKKRHEEPLLLAEKTVKARIAGYLSEEARKREEAALRARQAELERRRLEEQALREAAAAEERARTAKTEPEREAARAEASAVMETAAAIETQIVEEFLAPIPLERPRVNGLSMRETWNFEITDREAIPREYLIPDLVAIRKIVLAMKDRTNIPGIRVFTQSSITARIA